ncbi:hypothetical protein K9L63_01345 [Candidatus Gracilibacteria bacterium]|nr:hypothetical protein [Candidatus Gracilibacteria bacterium]
MAQSLSFRPERRNPLKNEKDLSTRPALAGLGRDDNTEGIFFHLCNFTIG